MEKKSFIKIYCLAIFILLANNVIAQRVKNDTIIITTSAQCEICKERIEKNLVYEPGIKSANLNLETKNVTIVYKPEKIDANKIKEVISKTGYDADEIPADEKAYSKLPPCCQKNSNVKHE